jgi:hypothetical protein
MHRAIKPHPHHLRDAARIVAIGLIDLRLQLPLARRIAANVAKLRQLFGRVGNGANA